MENVKTETSLADVDPRLLEEAFRRARTAARNAGVDSDALLSAIVNEARRGARDLYSLVAAAGRPADAA